MAPAALPLNVWTHMAFSYDGANGSIYVNGSLAVSGAMADMETVLKPAVRAVTAGRRCMGLLGGGGPGWGGEVAEYGRCSPRGAGTG